MICNICEEEAEKLDKVSLSCKKCNDSLEKRWNITYRYFEESSNGSWSEFIHLENMITKSLKKLKGSFVADGYGFRFEYQEIKE